MGKQFLYFIFNGAMATFVHFLILLTLVELFLLEHLLIANIFSGICATFFAYLGNKYFVFKSRSNKKLAEVTRFFLTYLIIIIFHSIALSSLTLIAGLDYRVSFVIVSAILAILSFLINKFLVFRL